VNTACSTGI